MSVTKDTGESSATESITPHQVISLLLDGALERIDLAIASVSDGDIDEADLLVKKTIAIVDGLRESLNFDQGGDIANNLNDLYEYILQCLDSINSSNPIQTLKEVKNLLSELHMGWSAIKGKENSVSL